MRFHLLFFCVFVARSLASHLPNAHSDTLPLDVFHSIQDCLPFNILVQPSNKNEYKLVVDSDVDLLNAIEIDVHAGTLYLGLKNGFKTEHVMKVTLYMPADTLKHISKSSQAQLVVGPGLDVSELTISARGAAGVYVFDAKVNSLAVEAEDISDVYVEGHIQTANFVASGTARICGYGIEGKVEVYADSIGRIYVKVANPHVRVEGRLSDIGTVYVANGGCHVRGDSIGGCKRIKQSQLPQVEGTYSCGLEVNGEISCQDYSPTNSVHSSTSVTTSAGTTHSSSSSGSMYPSSVKSSASASSMGSASAISKASASSSSSTGGAYSSISSSTGTGGVVVTTVSSSPAGTSSAYGSETGTLAVVEVPCEDSEVSMFD